MSVDTLVAAAAVLVLLAASAGAWVIASDLGGRSYDLDRGDSPCVCAGTGRSLLACDIGTELVALTVCLNDLALCGLPCTLLAGSSGHRS